MADHFYRKLLMLQHIPRAPGKIGTHDLMATLENEGFGIDLRTVQRDLRSLQDYFPNLVSDENRDIPGWSWKFDGEMVSFPAMDPPTALTFQMANQFLGKLMPPAILDLLKPYLDKSREILEKVQEPGLGTWKDKVAIVPRTQPLIPAEIEAGVVRGVYTALLQGKQFRGRYRNRNGDVAEYVLNPLGVVYRDSVIYLVATAWDYEDLRHYALHRFAMAETMETDANRPPGYSLAGYIETGTFDYVVATDEKIRLEVLFDKPVGEHLRETPISADQVISVHDDQRYLVKATVKNSDQLRWWLLGFGAFVEVLRPTALRDEFKRVHQACLRRYGMK